MVECFGLSMQMVLECFLFVYLHTLDVAFISMATGLMMSGVLGFCCFFWLWGLHS